MAASVYSRSSRAAPVGDAARPGRCLSPYHGRAPLSSERRYKRTGLRIKPVYSTVYINQGLVRSLRLLSVRSPATRDPGQIQGSQVVGPKNRGESIFLFKKRCPNLRRPGAQPADLDAFTTLAPVPSGGGPGGPHTRRTRALPTGTRGIWPDTALELSAARACS